MRWVIVFIVWATAAAAVEPSEMLSDPILEQRAQALDELLRCVQCRSENIASSNAGWASDARGLVREMISAGASDQQVLDRFVKSYGEVVLMKPVADGWNIFLWLAGPILLIFTSLGFVRTRKSSETTVELSQNEAKAVAAIIKENSR